MLGLDSLTWNELAATVTVLLSVITQLGESKHELELEFEAADEKLRSALSRLEESNQELKLELAAERGLQSVLAQRQEKNLKLKLELFGMLEKLEKRCSTLKSIFDALRAQLANDRSDFHSLNRQLVQAKTANDTMKNRIRVQHTQLGAMKQQINELLKNLAMAEHDLELERANSASNKVSIANHQNEVREPTEKLKATQKLCLSNRGLPHKESCGGNILVLCMRRVLLAGPPTPQALARRYLCLPSLQQLRKLHLGVSQYMVRSGLMPSESQTPSSFKTGARLRPSPALLPSIATGSQDSLGELPFPANKTDRIIRATTS